MKKLLGSVLALVMLFGFSWPAGATEILKNLKVNGSMDFQATSARNVLDFNSYQNDRIGTAMTRVIVDTNWDLLDDFHSVITLRKNDRAWGANTSAGQGSDGGQRLVGNAANDDIASSVVVQQAYVKIDKFAGQLDAQVGRQYYGEPGDLVVYFGPKGNYGLYVTALDGFRVDWNNDMLGITGLAAKFGANNIGTNANTESDLRGIDVLVKNMPAKLNAFIYNSVGHRNSTNSPGGVRIYEPNNNLWIYGVKAKMEAEGAYVTAQLAGNLGELRETSRVALYRGWAGLFDAGYKAEVANVGNFTPWLNFGFGTGDQGTGAKSHGFTSIASGYTPGIINGRFNNSGAQTLECQINGNAYDVGTVGLTNRVIYGLGLKATPAAAERLVLGLGFWDYRYQTMTTGDTRFHVNSAVANAKTSRHIGYEYGLTADWKHSENVTYGMGVARFHPGRLINDANSSTAEPVATRGGVSPIFMAFADMALKF
ncbi:MAG: hypothetical protein A3J79_08415 [Elusimicrobia bacterium RIFOXYB2_FULL_62_6]|nr:MAG: hypothetical protein A3J79_08415 [Elusimicrobia bacterium RIFOXYB2_FULL_62_6]